MSYNINIKSNGNYEPVQNIYIKHNDTYTEVKNVYVKESGQYVALKKPLQPIIHFDSLNNTGNGLDTSSNLFVNLANPGIYDGVLSGWNNSNSKWENKRLAFHGNQQVHIDFNLFNIGEFTIQIYVDDRGNNNPWRDYICCYNTNEAAEPWKIERTGVSGIAVYGGLRFLGINEGDAVVSRTGISTTEKFTYTVKCTQQTLTAFVHKGTSYTNKASTPIPNGINPNNYVTNKMALGRRYQLNTQSNGTTMNLYNLRIYNKVLSDDEILNNHLENVNKYN